MLKNRCVCSCLITLFIVLALVVPASHATASTLTVNKAGAGTGTVNVSPPGGPGGACSVFPCVPTRTIYCFMAPCPQLPYEYYYGEAVTLSATPAAGSIFEGWSEAPCSGASTCSMTMLADKTITATFSVPASRGNHLPGTGQTISYAEGDDADYNNFMSFTDNGNGTVRDNNTGLIWQKQDSVTYMPWADANSYCSGLNLGGATGWRVPSVMELMSIADYGRENPALDQTYFTVTPYAGSVSYWSSTHVAGSTASVWSMDLSDGIILPLKTVENGGTYYEFVRCVRGESIPSVNFTDKGNGTVTDNSTGLIWQKGEGGPMNWGEALSYCRNLSLAGEYGWRLPNIKELASIIDPVKFDPTKSNPPMDKTYFPNAYAGRYVSSTTWIGMELDALDVRSNTFMGGSNKTAPKAPDYVRCVSDGILYIYGPGMLTVHVTDALTGAPIESALITTSAGRKYITPSDGSRFLAVPAGAMTLTASKSGYVPSEELSLFISDFEETVVNINLAPATPSINRGPATPCSATMNADFTVHVPIGIFNGQAYSADFQWDGGSSVILRNLTPLFNTSAFSSCAPAAVTSDLVLHIPVIMYNGVSYWAKVQCNTNGLPFAVLQVGQN